MNLINFPLYEARQGKQSNECAFLGDQHHHNHNANEILQPPQRLLTSIVMDPVHQRSQLELNGIYFFNHVIEEVGTYKGDVKKEILIIVTILKQESFFKGVLWNIIKV